MKKNVLADLKTHLDKRAHYRKKYRKTAKPMHRRVLKSTMTKTIATKDIVLAPDGIFVELADQMQQGYLYNKYHNISRFGYPKAHLMACSVIQKQQKNGYFEGHYYWSNLPKAKVVDKQTDRQSRGHLAVCKFCVKLLEGLQEEAPLSIDEFHAQQVAHCATHQPQLQPMKVGRHGYSNNWQQISSSHRANKNYTCQKCKFTAHDKEDQKFIHVDHIDGNKMNNRSNNLQVLCILCHSKKDDLHQKNFSKGNGKIALNKFLRKHKGGK